MKLKPNIEVLIIEDDLRIAEIQKRFIEQIAGFQTVGIAASYLEAKTYIDLLKETKQQNKQMDVIMITATKEIHKVQEAISIGVFDYIIKPVIFERFKQSLLRYQDFHTKLVELRNENLHVTQQQVDKLLRKEIDLSLSEKAYLPKGIDPLTLEKVLDVLSKVDFGLTAEFVAKEIGVSRTTARRYLEHLMSEEKIAADLAYGTVGRPERVYLVKSGVK